MSDGDYVLRTRDAGEAEAMAHLLDDPPAGAHMLTPLVAEIIARKL